jgi:hypothetical protein
MSNNTTFWKFLENHTVEIPIIQRDYAQGRKGKEELRRKFLTDLKSALDSKYDKTELKLDFVYGSKENDRLNPLDGQQRLTTLWLLHWYIAYKAGKLRKEKEELSKESKSLKKFTYETRISSREFCEHLSEFSTEKSKEFQETISDFIQQQTWFYSAWKQDPTIQSMLRMLSGTPNKDKDGQEIIDGLEELFSDCTREDYEKYWTRLSGDNCSIVFYYLDLLGLNLSDDLYIKMNARGEQLTSFENFKADLVGYIKEQKWANLLDATNGIPIKMDTTWTDIFWKNKAEDGKIDEIYFAFLNRFFLNEFICNKKDDKYAISANDFEKNSTFNLLYGNKSDDSKTAYLSFEKYKDCISNETLASLKSMLDNFAKFISGNTLDKTDELFQPNWGKTGFSFIPKYAKDKSITTSKQPQRIVFYAICKYFEKDEYNESSFRQWMRVVWNLVENGNINTIDSMVANIRLIDELSEHSHGIYTFFANDINKINSDANKEQLKEEREKAKKIIENNSWEEKIISAEKYAFFKGAIRFLFHDGKREVNWSHFDTKWGNAKKYFNKDGKTENTAILLRNLISHFTKWEQFWGFSYSNETWKFLLTSSKWANPVHLLLTNELANNFENYIVNLNEYDPNLQKKQKKVQEDLVRTDLLNRIADKRCVLNWKYDNYALYPSNARADYNKYVIANPRNSVLSALLKEGKITSNQKIDGCDFFWGWDINFKYKHTDGQEYSFRWQYSDWVDMYEGNEKLFDRHSDDNKQLHTLFNGKEDGFHFTDADSLVKEMIRCIDKYKILQCPTFSDVSKS